MTRRRLRLVSVLAATALATPAVAQMDHSKMNMPGMTMPMLKRAAPTKPAPKKAAPKKATAKAPARKAPAKRAPKKKAAPTQRAAAKAKPAANPHAGHDMSAMPGMDMPAGLDMNSMKAAPTGTDLPAGDALPPSVPTDRAANAVYGAEAMHMGQHHLVMMHGGQKFSQVMLNLAEYQLRRSRGTIEWDGEAWYGGDIDRLWVKSEGDAVLGRSVERAEVQALYSHAISPYFNLQGGLRYDIKPNPSRVYAALALEGLAPSFFDVEGSLFLSNKGELLARAEGYYDQRITQRLILQPRAELNFAAQSSRDIGVGKGLSDGELGLRLRYDIRREFAPYVGVQYQRAFGDTRRYRHAAGEDGGGLSMLVGIRTWF